MPKLIIIRGNSGSGKSSLAKALQRQFGRNTLVIPQDTVRREMLWAKDGVDTTALPLLISLLQYGHDNSKITIIEGILNSDWYKPLFEKAIDLYGKNIFAYYYELPFEETLKRHQTKSNKFDFGEEDMRRWWKEKDYIGIIEERALTKEITLDDATKIIFSDVQYN